MGISGRRRKVGLLLAAALLLCGAAALVAHRLWPRPNLEERLKRSPTAVLLESDKTFADVARRVHGAPDLWLGLAIANPEARKFAAGLRLLVPSEELARELAKRYNRERGAVGGGSLPYIKDLPYALEQERWLADARVWVSPGGKRRITEVRNCRFLCRSLQLSETNASTGLRCGSFDNVVVRFSADSQEALAKIRSDYGEWQGSGGRYYYIHFRWGERGSVAAAHYSNYDAPAQEMDKVFGAGAVQRSKIIRELSRQEPEMTRKRLVAELSHPNAHRRWHALAEFCKLGSDASGIVPQLIKLIEENESLYVRLQAIHTLDYAGTAAQAAVPVLKKARNDKNGRIRSAAAFILDNLPHKLKKAGATGR